MVTENTQFDNTRTKTITPECQIVVFNWKHDRNIEDLSVKELSEAYPHDISNYIKEVSFGKQMSSPSGQFQIVLENDRDWKQYIKKGSWCVIYMSNDGGLSLPDAPMRYQVDIGNGLKGDIAPINDLIPQSNKCRCIGYIDTIRAQGSVGEEKGEFDTTFVISGRDIGIVYEETEIWHNRIKFDTTLLNTANTLVAASSIKTVDKLLNVMHRLFFSPEDIVNQDLKNDSLTQIALQWLLPQPLFRILGIPFTKSGTYYGNIPNLLNLEPSKSTYPVESPLTSLNGVAWQRLKQFSIEPFHELYPELGNNGLPRLNFRPFPWRLTNGAKYKTLAPTVKLFKDIERVKLSALDILNFDLGEDNHTRYNLFWSTISTSMVNIQTSNQLIGDNNAKTGFPRVLQNSVRRHGLRLLYSEVNANIVIGEERANPDLIRQYNELALEYWKDSHNFESGTLEIVGNNEIRLGKTVHIEKGAPYNSDKVLYIEGYEETFMIGEKGESSWTQSLFLTRGIEDAILQDSRKLKDLGIRQESYTDSGEFTGS